MGTSDIPQQLSDYFLTEKYLLCGGWGKVEGDMGWGVVNGNGRRLNLEWLNTIQYTVSVLQSCIPKTYITLFTTVTPPINSVLEKHLLIPRNSME